MLRTVEAVLEEDGRLRLLERVEPGPARRVLVTFLEERGDPDNATDTALLSEAALGEDWERAEESEAWQHLQ